MSYETLLVAVSARGVASVALNRPERGNALNGAMIDELGACFEALGDDASVRVIVLRGKGKHFCAGADMAGAKSADAKFTLAAMMQAIDTCPKPTIAVVHGAAIGGGFALSAVCDVILATSAAFFSIPEVKLGMAPSPALAGLFMRAIGYRNLRRYGFTGERISAAQGLAFGHVSEIAEADEIDAKVESLCESMLLAAPGALALLKKRIAEFGAPPASVLYDPATRDVRHARSGEAIEGVAAFREKRKPKWFPQ